MAVYFGVVSGTHLIVRCRLSLVAPDIKACPETTMMRTVRVDENNDLKDAKIASSAE